MAQPDFGDNYKNVRYRVTVQDEDGVVRFQDLVDQIVSRPLVVAKPSTVRVLFSALTTSYARIGTLDRQCAIVQVLNSLSSASGVDIGLSLDGVNDAWRLEANEGFVVDLHAANRKIMHGQPLFAKYYTSSGYVQPTAGTLRVVCL